MQSKFLLAFLIIIALKANAQTAVISGKIIDESNSQPLVGATVVLKNNSAKTLSDVDGVYRFTKLHNGNYIIQVSYVGYVSKKISDIEVKNGEITNLNIALSFTQNTTLQNVVLTTTGAKRESINSILIARKNAAVVSDAISADMIRRSPDKNVSDVLKRVSGTSIQENKFVIVRGMSDRYNEALLNGALLPSTEADRKTFAFDIFPSDIIDNITIIKSASAEYPGSFAGGLILVNLKDVPDKNYFAFKTGAGINTITTGKSYYHQDNSNSDYIGIDNGLRALPNNFPSNADFNALPVKEKQKLGQQFSNGWQLHKDVAPLNSLLQLSGAVTTNAKNNYPRFGALFALSYNSTYRTSHIVNRDYGAVKVLPDSVDKGIPYYDYNDTFTTQNILSSALANFTVKINPNNKFFFNNLLAVNSTIQTVVRGGQSQAGTGVLSPYYAYAHGFQSNVIYNGQVGGEHYLSKLKLRIKWLTYLTNFHKNEPDYRQMIYFKPYENQPFYAYLATPTVSSTTNGGTIFYYDTKDVAKGINIDFNKSFKFLNNTQSLKFGFASFNDSRKRDGRFLRIDQNDGGRFDQSLLTLAPDKIFAKNNFDSRTGFVLTDFAQRQWYYYQGTQTNTAGYVMLDNKFTNKIRFSYGLRVENYNNKVRSFQDVVKKLKVDTTHLDYLPSANFIYSVLPKANIRLSYSRTVARPLYRELAATQFYDFILNAIYYGGYLNETKIDNYEVRWEQYFKDAQYYSVSAFYKKFKDPIEQKIVISGADSKTITWQNAPSAKNEGIELEARKNLDFISPALSEFYLYANTAFIKSTAYVVGNGSDTANRPLQGQSPYIFNASIQYTNAQTGINISALYNVIGERIFLVGGNQEPYVWEKPHPQLDLKISKTFLKNGLVELSLADVLHKDDVLFWDENGNKKYDANYPDVLIQSRNFGMTATLSIGYRF